MCKKCSSCSCCQNKCEDDPGGGFSPIKFLIVVYIVVMVWKAFSSV